ncbi:MAG: histidine kinase [Gammaproteobacteria bacterium (ex Lamellibrachia satsuma)]|nr:MAG: EAL domain-containing protein [Gammaproteobacteria bacterium (ex Lamellibrachia satsuma)]RRS31291.1 MAG: histidine kinase [Gammaproteobacteria bacterium (ex Lamellibrachia satsuma)]RRS36966.1 MAG: histidine kinase [Gammaproteobacteria bacterium (ex Lamellibrachia satsuma)]
MTDEIRVLIIEDSEDDALLLVRELRKGGYTPSFQRVDSPQEVKAALERDQWDLVITDHNMPQFSSTDALRLAKTHQPDIPIIIVSGSIGEEVAVQAMKAGAHDYLMKDNLKRLIPAVERELRDADTRRAHRRAEEEIRHLAFHDVLTGLANRHEFDLQLNQVLESAKRDGLVHALFYLDLDQFKLINDTCGHMAGDELLRQLSILLQSHVRGNDILARLGGDEFGVLLKGCPLERANQIADGIRLSIAGFRFVWDEQAFVIGVSIGVAMITAESASVEDVLSKADIACYTAKDRGRDRVHVYSENDIETARRYGDMQWVNRIREALEIGRFQLYQQVIQPLSDSAGGMQTREFLVRMLDEQGEIIAPGAFIPAAEHYNLMPQVDRWVVQRAFSHLAEQEHRGSGRDTLTFINLSGNSLSDESFFDFIRKKLRDHHLNPQRVCFEVTETAAISNLGSAIEFIRECKKAGCRFALDDFGSGMSSFSYLRSIPVDFLKIDGTFVKNMVRDPMDAAIVEAINGIGHVAGIKTIAEFVENEAIRKKLCDIGVDFGQGYGIHRPQPLVG